MSDTLHVVQFSGGAASSLVARLVAQEHGRENTVMMFHDTKAEHPDAYRFRRDVAEHIGLPITDASSGKSLWECIVAHNALPSVFLPFCTRELKGEPGNAYLASLDRPFVVYNGFTVEEWRRVQKATLRSEAAGHRLVSPLYERRVYNADAKRIIQHEWGIRLPQPYEHLEHNNCIPCFKSESNWYWYQVWRHYPESFAKAAEMERLVKFTVFENVSLGEKAEQWRRKPPKNTAKAGAQAQLPCECWT